MIYHSRCGRFVARGNNAAFLVDAKLEDSGAAPQVHWSESLLLDTDK